MTDRVQVIAVAVSVTLMLLVLELVRRRKLTEEYSFIWIVCAAALLLLSVWRNILDIAAQTLGVYYPPAVLLLVLIFFVFVVSLSFSVVVSQQRQQIERLVEEIALLDADVRELRESKASPERQSDVSIRPIAAPDVVPRATNDRRETADNGHVGR